MWAFGQMQFAHSHIKKTPGLNFYKLMGSGREPGFNPLPDWSVYALLCNWENENAANDFFQQADGSLYAICGDATGHGTPSGMLVSITKAGIIGLPQMSPKDMLHELNRVVKKVDLGILRMSLNIALVKDNQITLSSAGMPPYFIYRAATNTTEEIQLSGVPLGSFNDVHFDQTTTDFNQGDILVIISDGLPEAPNLTGELFDYQKLQDLIATYGSKTAQEVIDQLMIEADAWLSGNHNPDDITLVVIKHQ